MEILKKNLMSSGKLWQTLKAANGKYDKPFTTITYVDGTTREVDIVGEARYQDVGKTGITDEFMIQKIDVGTDVTVLGDYFAQGCKNLTEVTIPQTVVLMKYSAFSGASNLKRINSKVDGLISLPGSITDIVATSQHQTSLNYGGCGFFSCIGITDVVINEGTEYLAGENFIWCDNIRTVKLPKSLKNIGYGCFRQHEKSLVAVDCTSFDDPTQVPNIGSNLFSSDNTGFQILVKDAAMANAFRQKWTAWASSVTVK